MKIKTTKIKGKELKEGDLFSSVGSTYWSNIESNIFSLGEKVYIRTKNPCPKDQEDETIYKISIEK